MDVALLRWPGEEERRRALAAGGVPRLLLVDPDAGPPVVADELEDWIRVPADEADVQARAAALRRRSQARAVPTLDEDGVLRHRGAAVVLPPVECRLVRALLARPGAVVARDVLTGAGWPGANPGRNVLDVHVLRLRRRLAPLGLAIRTVRSRGYALELHPPAGGDMVGAG